jgi:AraC family transcriptional regulator
MHFDSTSTRLLSQIQWVLRDAGSSAEDRLQRVGTLVNSVTLHDGTQSIPQQGAENSAPRGGLAPWQVNRLRSFVAERLSDGIRNTDMARLVRLSPHHFCRAFRVSLKVTPHAFILRKRVEKACALMQTSRATLGQIAIECGFADQAHFNRIFRKLLNSSPGAWRRLHARTAGGERRSAVDDYAGMTPRVPADSASVAGR